MVIRDNEDDVTEPLTKNHTDEPPSYETVQAGGPSNGRPAYPVDDKLKKRSFSDALKCAGANSASGPPGPNSPSRLPSSDVSKQVRQTICTLIRDLVLNAESPNLLDSCANACRTYHLDFPALLQDPFIERHSPIYWAILKSCGALLPSLLVHAASLSQSTISEIRLACLVTGNQDLFQSLRCKCEYLRGLAPLKMSCRADTIVLGSVPSDAVSIHDLDGQGPFVADMRINLWQKRMRAVGIVSVEFIARGRIWSLRFTTPASSTVVGTWNIELGLLEYSPPTFINSKLVIDLPPPSLNSTGSPANTSQRSELISLSPPPDGPSRNPAARYPPPSPTLSQLSKSNAPKTIELRLNSKDRVAYRDSKFLEQWTGNDCNIYTNAIIVPLGEELMYDNTPFLGTDGTLYARFEARLEQPE